MTDFLHDLRARAQAAVDAEVQELLSSVRSKCGVAADTGATSYTFVGCARYNVAFQLARELEKLGVDAEVMAKTQRRESPLDREEVYPVYVSWYNEESQVA